MSANQLARTVRYESRPKKVLDADINDLLGSGQVPEPIVPDTSMESEDCLRDVAVLARKMLAVVLAGRTQQAMRRRAIVAAHLLAPALTWPHESKSDLARYLGVSRAAVTLLVKKVRSELLET